MAGSTHYRYKFTNELGELFDVQIKDTTYSGTDFATVCPDGNGFNISWEGDTSTSYTPILSATFTAVLHNDTNSRTLVNDIVAGTGGQFIISLYKWNTSTEYWDRMWSGPVNLDSISIPDASYSPPVEYITITATDGFGSLKDTLLPFTLTNLTRYSVEYYIWSALMAISGDDDYRAYEDTLGGTQTRCMTCASTWYEDSMDSSVVTDANHGDPLSNTLINESAFIKVDDYGVATAMNYYDILVKILTAFNLQISQWNGTFLIIQQNINTQAQTRAWYFDWQNCSYIDTELINLQTTMPDRFTGGVFTHILPAKIVKTEYEYRNGIYGQNLLPYNVDEEVVYSCGLSTQNRQLVASGRIETIFNDEAGTIVFVRVVYAVHITNGTYYLNYDETTGEFEWNTTSTNYIPVKTTFLKAGYHPTQTRFTDFDWLLPALPEEGQAITFEWEFLKLEDVNGDEYTATTPAIGSDDVEGTFNLHVDFEDGGEGTYLFKASVNNSAIADLELETAILGDGPNNYSAGALTVIDSTDTIVNSNVWTIYSEIGGTAIALNSLRCKEMLALRRSTVQLYEGTFFGVADIHKGFTWLSKNWVWLSMSYDCGIGQYTGTAMALNVSRTSITISTPVQSQNGSGGSSGGGGNTIQTVNLNVNDGIFDLSLIDGELSVAPYSDKKATDPGFGYVYTTSKGELPSYASVEYFDFSLYLSLAMSVCDGNYQVRLESDSKTGGYLYCINSADSEYLPLFIGDAKNQNKGNHLKLDDANELFTIDFADVLLNQGTASKALALDAYKKITYADYDNFSHFKAGVDSTLYDIYKYNDATHYIGIDFIAGDGMLLTPHSGVNKCLQIEIASTIKEYAGWTAKGYSGETSVSATVENNETVEFIGTSSIVVTPEVVSSILTRFTFEAKGFDKSIFARLTSDVSSSSTSAVNITGLSLALEANSVYEIEVSLNVGVSAEASGTAYGLSFSGAGTNTFFGHLSGVSTGTSVLSRYINALDNQYGAYCQYSGGSGGVLIKGILTTGSAAGNLTAQHVKLTSGTSYVYKGSFIKAIKR